MTMPQTTLYDRTGASVGSVDLAEALFAAPVNEAVLHQAVVAQLAGRRLGTSDTKTRGEVRAGHEADATVDRGGSDIQREGDEEPAGPAPLDTGTSGLHVTPPASP